MSTTLDLHRIERELRPLRRSVERFTNQWVRLEVRDMRARLDRIVRSATRNEIDVARDRVKSDVQAVMERHRPACHPDFPGAVWLMQYDWQTAGFGLHHEHHPE